MTRYLLPYLFVFIISSGCAIYEAAKRENNIFELSDPVMVVKIDPKFKYLGDIRYYCRRPSTRGTRSLGYDRHVHVFIQADGLRAKKALLIGRESIETKYGYDLFTRYKNKLEGGTCQIGRERYQYCTRLFYPSLVDQEARYISEKGYQLPECVLFKHIARVVGDSHNTTVGFVYIEDLSDSGYGSKAWESKDNLAEAQIRYLENFNVNCVKSFEVLK